MPDQLEVPARRRGSTGEFEREGDYCVVYDEGGAITSVWFNMPGFGEWGRILAEASTDEGPKWTITEDGQGKLTVEPSIETTWNQGPIGTAGPPGPRKFHVYLRADTWVLLGDRIGSSC